MQMPSSLTHNCRRSWRISAFAAVVLFISRAYASGQNDTFVTPQGPEAFALLEQLCIATRADRAAALAAADALGWQAAPQGLLDQMKPEEGIGRPEGRMLRSARANLILVVLDGMGNMFDGRASTSNPTVKGVFCAIAAVPAQPAAIDLAVNYAAVPRNAEACDDPNDRCFVWQERDGAHVTLTPATYKPGSGLVYALMIADNPGVTIIGYGVGTP
jgi:hypothetical protein